MKTAVALFLYQRPRQLKAVFDAIAAARPTRLFIVADGPRSESERAQCEAARTVVADIDWPCDVERLYADHNLGIRQRLGSGLDWVFSHVEEAVILEEDCLPSPAFFSFCNHLLERYRDDERVFGIAGANYQFGRRRSGHSYYFSGYCGVWGWATWKRSWQHYDLNMADWPALDARGLLGATCNSRRERAYWRWIFERTYRGDIDTWDYQLQLAMWKQNALFVVPEVNLVSNIGFGTGSTHTWRANSPLAAIPHGSLADLDHPAEVYRNTLADRHTFSRVLHGNRPIWLRNLTRTLRGR
jgi:hypothetical protein